MSALVTLLKLIPKQITLIYEIIRLSPSINTISTETKPCTTVCVARFIAVLVAVRFSANKGAFVCCGGCGKAEDEGGDQGGGTHFLFFWNGGLIFLSSGVGDEK